MWACLSYLGQHLVVCSSQVHRLQLDSKVSLLPENLSRDSFGLDVDRTYYFSPAQALVANVSLIMPNVESFN